MRLQTACRGSGGACGKLYWISNFAIQNRRICDHQALGVVASATFVILKWDVDRLFLPPEIRLLIFNCRDLAEKCNYSIASTQPQM